MFIKHARCYADFILLSFSADAFPIPAPDLNFGDFGRSWVHVGSLWISISKSASNFVSNVCAVEFILDFRWVLGAGWGSQGDQSQTGDAHPALAFSDIWGQNKGFRLREVAF